MSKKVAAKTVKPVPVKGKPSPLPKKPAKPDTSYFDKLPKIKKSDEKNKLVVEYIVHASPGLLYQFLSSPSGLAEWFADNVNISGDTYTFVWDGAQQQAKLLSSKDDKYIRFQWLDRPDTYFEFKIDKNELTDEISLSVTDFAENEGDRSSLENLWESQIRKLKKTLGSH